MAAAKINSLLILIALAMAPTLHQANAADITAGLCGQTTPKAVCVLLVEADPRANLKTSPNGIATILRDKASATASATSAKISSLLRGATNRREIAALKSCSAGYNRAISSLRSADFKVIDRRTYATLVAAISNANDEPRDCELSFQEPPAVRSPISAENERLREICATTLEIINLRVCRTPFVDLF
ncbi:pectinesterase inhibitor-like [Sesamum indicum]|uniref:Pectinesterase inhibitor-like n=1 Tax=Sesamum indicum TaxID=4182 RepID=A0A6I9TTF0_SESIN|nr:pectinesterase inhibitor-like [Sesamum indicum]